MLTSPITLSQYNNEAKINSRKSNSVIAEPSEKEKHRKPDLLACWMSIITLCPQDELLELIMSKEKSEVQSFMDNSLQGCLRVLQSRIVPDSWVVMIMLLFQVNIKLLHIFKDILIESIEEATERGQESIDDTVITAYIQMCIAIILDRSLQLETFSDAKKNQLADRYGDLRVISSLLLQELWENLGAYKIQFEGLIVSNVLQLMMVDQEDIRNFGTSLYFSCMTVEYAATGSFAVAERATVDKIDSVVKDEASELLFQQHFLDQIADQLKGTSDENMLALGNAFLQDIRNLLARISELRNYSGPEFEDERIACTLQLMMYLKSTGRIETFIRYAHELVDLHVRSNNYTEAGYAMLLHSNLWEWNDDAIVTAVAHYPEQSQLERKMKLYDEAVDFFARGKTWEEAIKLLHEQKNVCENITYDYNRLAQILHKQADMYLKIIEEDRFYAEYFRVGYYGSGFPESYNGKEFIYRGFELERVSEFVARIQAKFPQAQMIKNNKPPEKDIIESTGQHIQIVNVHPATFEERDGKDPVVNERQPERIRQFHKNNGIKLFSFSRPIKMSKTKSDNEFKDLWLNNTYLEIQDTFPTFHRRAEVIKSDDIILSPLEYAVKSVRDKNGELTKTISANKHSTKEDYQSSFTMALNGVIDAAVNGGVYMYVRVRVTGEQARTRLTDHFLFL
eukprot:TRINITY_DN7864_c0_g1_i7.p1 TRINITY_DN7864_c0_g1~~TRINITY_DN7864_c0_g1_i7.p1  ORF type:complete len:680 (-),score=211.99 TRINITY_DN7864_c0_g1_i7:2278-4317(-)